MSYFTPPYFVNVEGGRSGPLSMPVVFDDLGPPRYEYHVVTIDLREDEPLDETALQSLGKDGWLLAGLLPPADGGAKRLIYYFVRPTV
jgi:hypothetical protein